MQLTREQQEILAQPPDRTMLWQAYAGCAKTTTCVEYAKAWVRPSLYLAFNASIAAAAQGRFPDHVEARTAHGYAYRAMEMGRFRDRLIARLRPDHLEPLRPILKPMGMISDIGMRRLALGVLQKYVISDDAEVEIHHLANVPMQMRPAMLPVMRKACAVLLDYENTNLPITHDLYLKRFALHGRIASHHEVMFIDEAQDLNPVLIGIAKRSGLPCMVVGDPHQSVYAFRGATDAMSHFKGPTFPLSQSFRFGPEIARYANWILRQKLEVPEVPVSGTHARQTRVLENEGRLKLPATILARTNIRILQSLIQSDVRFHLIGGIDNLAQHLLVAHALWRGLDRSRFGWDPVVSPYASWNDLVEAAEAEDDPELPRLVELVETYRDRLPDMVAALKQRHVPNEQNAPLVVSTAHQAKGREWGSVALLDDFPLPSQMDRMLRAQKISVTAYHSELHLLYVAGTRAMDQLSIPEDLFAAFAVGSGLAAA